MAISEDYCDPEDYEPVPMPALHIKPRTRQLDDSKPVVLHSNGTDQGTVWTDSGQLKMNGDENAELSNNLAQARFMGVVTKIAEAIYEEAARFFQATCIPMMPDSVREPDQIVAWLTASGLEMRMDGLTCIVSRNGMVLATSTPEVEPMYQEAVTRYIQSSQEILRAGEGNAA